MMKKTFSCMLAAAVLFSFTACGQQASQASSSSQAPQSSSSSEPPASSEPAATESESSSSSDASTETVSSEAAASQPDSSQAQQTPTGGNAENGTLVVYFSATGNTKAVAETIAETLNADLYELVPEQPYTDADLNWNDPSSRVNAEHEDPSHRTAIAGGVKDLSGYGTIFIGYPLWWREAPSIVWNFVESSDLAGKTVIPFCTSMSDGFGSSGDTLEAMAPDANWQEGQRFGENLDAAAVAQWVNSLGLDAAASASAPQASAASILIAYFSMPEDVDTSGVDAVAGASIVMQNGRRWATHSLWLR